MILLWLKFIITALIIIFSGIRLCHYGDQIAQRTGLTRAWIGIILIAAITSLPEVVTSLGAALMVRAPDLALGNLMGSNAFNLMALGFLLIIYRQRRPTSKIVGGAICSLFGIILVGIVGAGILFHSPFSLGWFGLDSLLILTIYLLGMRLVYKYEHRDQRLDIRNQKLEKELPITRFVIAALFIVGAGICLAKLGEEIAIKTLWDRTFVGSLFLAVSTSLPEVVVAGTALKIGALDMAIGALLGSNMFNLAIIPLTDIFYRHGPILKAVSSTNLLTVGIVIVLTIVTLGGFLYRSKKKVPRFSPDSLLVVTIYLIGMYYLFKLR
ncbi:MAG: sodium:calcium antiporter [Firmicutes bacterium]|nr:sodium:calcium antiporter [Bacillota bacterium]